MKIRYTFRMDKIKLLISKWVTYLKAKQKDLLYYMSGETSGTGATPPIRQAVLFGFIVLGAFLGIFGLWALFAPLESASVANGKVIVATNRKTIQHLEGGIIKQILVKEGNVVKAGDPLIILEDTQASATVELLRDEANSLQANEARLTAERDHANITWPPELSKHQDEPDAQKIMKTQQELFESDTKAFAGQLQILQERIEQLNKQIESTQAQVTSNDEQLKWIGEELKAVEAMVEKKLVEKPRLWALYREAARLKGNRDELVGTIAASQQKIGETEQQIITLKDSTQQKILQQLTDIQSKLTDTMNRLKAAEDVLARTVIKAPQSGTVVGLQEHTIGGVIGAGKPILDIVPNQDELIIEARINPLDIDVVHVGLPARVQLVAYKRRSTPWLEGKVTYISADSFQDQQTNQSYYTARVTVDAKELKSLKNITLYPGMPVQVMIITDKLTPFIYFLTPIKDSFTRAFREQ